MLISIHVPLAGDDVQRLTCQTSDFDFYPRPPCGGRLNGFWAVILSAQFLSTSPLRGTTLIAGHAHFAFCISIHVPLAGDDKETAQELKRISPFLSTSPLRGTTSSANNGYEGDLISIHVPLAGDDIMRAGILQDVEGFLSTSPLRGTTWPPP